MQSYREQTNAACVMSESEETLDSSNRIFLIFDIRRRRSFPFRKRSMPFSRHLEIFLTANEFFSTKLKRKENLQVTA